MADRELRKLLERLSGRRGVAILQQQLRHELGCRVYEKSWFHGVTCATHTGHRISSGRVRPSKEKLQQEEGEEEEEEEEEEEAAAVALPL